MDQLKEQDEVDSQESRMSRRKFLKGSAYSAPAVITMFLASTPSYGFGGGGGGGGGGNSFSTSSTESNESSKDDGENCAILSSCEPD